MVNAISILGSTGSIGRQTLDVCREQGIKVAALTARSSIDLLERQAREFRPRLVAVSELEPALELARRLAGLDPVNFPRETAVGALALYISDETVVQFQPMNINFGIIAPLDHRVRGKRNKNLEISQRSLALLERRGLGSGGKEDANEDYC